MTDKRDESIKDALAKLAAAPGMEVRPGYKALWRKLKRLYPEEARHGQIWARLIQVELLRRMYLCEYTEDWTPEKAAQTILEVAYGSALEAGPRSSNTRVFIILSAMIQIKCWICGDMLLQWLDNSRFSDTPGTPSVWAFPPGTPCNPIPFHFPEGDEDSQAA